MQVYEEGALSEESLHEHIVASYEMAVGKLTKKVRGSWGFDVSVKGVGTCPCFLAVERALCHLAFSVEELLASAKGLQPLASKYVSFGVQVTNKTRQFDF